MGKIKTKSILSCAVLASVLAGGMVPVQAANVNAVVGPKDFNTLIGKSISFGQKRGYVENQTVSYPEGTPTWQIVAGDNGSITLLANQVWGKNRFSDTSIYNDYNPGAIIHQYFYREALQYLNENVAEFFTGEELNFLQNQTSVEAWRSANDSGKTEYSGIFALPTTGQVNALGTENRKRAFPYWLAESYDMLDGNSNMLFFEVNTVQTNGSIVKQPGQDAKHIYPTVALNKPFVFAYCKDKEQSDTFKSQNVAEPSAISLKNFTFKDTGEEKNVNITKLSVAQEGITFDANGLATGEGQGIGGLVEDASGNYLAYARLADSTNGMAENVKIKFDSSITGNNTIHLFNEWIGDKYDLAGNFNDLGVEMNSNKISELTYLPNVQELTLGDGVQHNLSGDRNFKKLTIGNGEFKYTAVNIPGAEIGSWNYTECQAVKVTEALDWKNVLQAEGEIILKGSFSVEDGTLTLVRPTNTHPYWRWGITGWNDITYNGQAGQSAILKVKGKMHGLIVNGGTFTAEKDLTLDDYLRVNNGAVVNLGGNVTTNNVNLNGTLNMTTADKTIMVSNALNATGDAQIIGVNSSDKVAVGGNLMADGSFTLENVILEAANVQVADGIRGGNNVSITANNLQVKEMLSAVDVTVDNLQFVCDRDSAGTLGVDTLTVKKFWNVADKNSQTGSIKNLNFGDGEKAACYRFDLGVDEFEISDAVTGEVRPITQYFSGLEDKTSYDVFTGGGNFSGLKMQDTRVTDMTGKKTYILTQDINDRGALNVKAAKHNAAVNFADVEKFAFGKYWQEDTNGDGKVNTADDKQPVVWSCVKQDNGQSVFLSEKILAETGGRVGDKEMYKITSFLKKDGAFAKDLFTTGELAILNVTNGDALGLPSLDDVKDGGNYGWNADGRKAQVSSYAGNGGRYYALGSTHDWSGDYINDWVDSSNGNIGTSQSLWIFSDGHYGIRPTISFDTLAVLFATNVEGGKGSCDVGNITKLQDVDSTSTLELTFDDAYLAAQNGIARKTGDVRVGVNKLEIGKDSIKTDYFTTYKDNNSYLSLFIGDAALPQDMFGYGKLAQVTKTGNGDLTLNFNDFTAKFADECVSGLALRFVNEYGNGTSLVGDFYDYGKMYLQDGKVTLDLPVNNLPRYNLSVAKGNKLIVRGTGKEDIISGDNRYLQIKGNGTVAFDKVVFSNKNLSDSKNLLECMDVEVNDATLRVEIDNRYENGAIALKTDGLVQLSSVKGMEGTAGKLFFDVARMSTGFSDSMWAFDTSKTLKCLDAITNDVTFDFGAGYVIVGSNDMYEFANGSSKGEVTVTRKKVGNGADNSGEAAFSLGWFQVLKNDNIDTVNFGGDFVNVDENHTLIDDQFTVNGNEHKLVGEEDAIGIIIGEEKTFTLKNISEISGFKDFAFRNGGTLNIIGETLLRGNILNYEEVPCLLSLTAPVLKATPVLMATPGMQEVVGTTNIDGSLIVDTPIIIENDLKFKDNGALKVFGSALNEGAAISGVHSLTVGENVALQFDPNGIRSLNSEYPIIDGDVTQDEMNKFQFDKGSIENIGTVFDANFAEGKITVNWNSDMANFGENLGVSRGAYTVAGLMGTAVQRHLKGKNTANLSSTLNPEPSTLERSSVWATYIHNKDKVDGLDLGFGAEAKYDAQYNGTIVGYDFNQNSGVALAYVDGNTSNGYGGHNDGKHYGVSVYSKKKLGKAILSGDISYIHGKNELRQDINWKNVKADAKTNTYSAGLHIANPVKLGQGTVTSFAGLRYMHINGKEYRNNLGVTYEGEKMNIFTAPFGLNYQVTVEDEKSGWTVTPSIEVGYAFNFGDRNNDMTVGYKTAKDSFGYDVTDKGYFFLQGGLNFTKKNLTMGVGYDFTKSSNSHNNRWNVNLTWSF